jgi:hypothetical protein
MEHQLSFAIVYRYPETEPGITVPVILSHGDLSYNTSAKVEPGAEVGLFSREIGEDPALQVESGLPTTLNSLGGPIAAFGHEITLQACELTFTTIVYFAKYPSLRRNLLGQQGWLRRLRIGIVDYDNLLYLSHYDD